MAKGMRIRELKGMSLEDLRCFSAKLKDVPRATLVRLKAYLKNQHVAEVGDKPYNINEDIDTVLKEIKEEQAEKEGRSKRQQDIEERTRDEGLPPEGNRGMYVTGKKKRMGNIDYRKTGMFYGGMPKKRGTK